MADKNILKSVKCYSGQKMILCDVRLYVNHIGVSMLVMSDIFTYMSGFLPIRVVFDRLYFNQASQVVC